MSIPLLPDGIPGIDADPVRFFLSGRLGICLQFKVSLKI